MNHEITIERDPAIDQLPTKAAKIRALDARGHARADIARFLDIRYQHVRNVLERHRTKEAEEQVAKNPAPETGIALSVSPIGQITIPEAFRQKMMLGEDGHVIAQLIDGELRIASPLAALRKAQEMLKPFRKEGESIVDEFLAERRAMWGEE